VTLGPLAALAATVAGIALGEFRGPGAATMTMIVGGACWFAALVAPRGRSRLAIVVIACGLVGTAGMQRAMHGLARSPLTAVVDARASVSVRAVLVDDPEANRFSTSVLVRASAVRVAGDPWTDAGGRRLVVRAEGDVAMRVGVLSAGDAVALDGWMEPLDGFDRRFRWKHAVATLHALDMRAAAPAPSSLAALANRARGVVMGGSRYLAPGDRALLAGFVLGDTRGVPTDVVERFRAAGLTHLLAVSGGNVAFVLALAAPLLRRLGLLGRFTTGLAVLVVFGAMTRWEPSVLRAVAMAALVLLSGYVGRPVPALRVLLVVTTGLLLADPFLLHSIGFLLSVTATFGIVVLARPIERRLPGPRWLREVASVTTAAQIGVAPLLVPIFGSLPLVALPANLLAVPLAGPLTVWGIVAGALGGVLDPLAPRVAAMLQVPTRALLHALLATADLAARAPVAVDGRGLAGLAALAALVGAAGLARTRSGHARIAGRSRRLRRDDPPVPAR
jgi:competence protein ComEC